jgi:4-hydroxythreonine-4-phosphate dehydrogenase
MSENKLLKIGITHGDFNSTNYEIIMKTLAEPKLWEICTPIVYGSAKIASYYRKALDMNDFTFQFIKNIEHVSLKKPNLLNITDQELKIEMGNASKISSNISLTSLQIASNDLKNNHIDALVTMPLCKKHIDADNTFKGHNHFLTNNFKSEGTILMLVADEIKMGLLSHQTILNQVSPQLSIEGLLKKIRTLNQSLTKDFLITNPKIAVLSFNHTKNGHEEKEKITPAINQAFEEKINVFGPFPATELFENDSYKNFDAILALHYEQAMIPFRLLSENRGVFYTAGLPIVRTAPIHHANFNNVGKNSDSEQSFRNAIYLAIDILRNRKGE